MKDILKKNNLKYTKARKAILDLLADDKKTLTAEEIYDELKKSIDTNLSTVYRNLVILTEKGILLKNVNLDNVSYYQIAGHGHSHQIVCQICKKSVPIGFCPMDDLVDLVKSETGFVVKGHSLEFIGICPDCQKKLKNYN